METITNNAGLIGKYQYFDDDIELTSYNEPVLVGTAVTTANSATINLPTGLEENDVVFVITGSGASTATTAPTGYTVGQAGAYNSTMYYRWSYKVMGSTPDTTASGLSVGTGISHMAFAFRNVDVNDGPFATTQVAIAAATTGTPNPPSTGSVPVTPNSNRVITIGWADNQSTASLVVAPTNFELIGSANGTVTTGCTIMAAFRTNTIDSVIINPGAFTGTTSASNVATIFVLRPTPNYTKRRRSGVWSTPAILKSRTETLSEIKSYYSLATNGSNTFTYPSAIRKGDLAIFSDVAASVSTVTIPSGATQFSSTGTSTLRHVVSYKVLLGNEGGTTVNGLTTTGGREKTIVLFRPSRPITSIAVTAGGTAVMTSANPVAHSFPINKFALNGSVILAYASTYNNAGSNVATWVGSTYGQVSPNAQNFTRWRTFNKNERKSNIIIDTTDTGSFNAISTFYMVIT